jgi:hypothetical protein
MQDLRWINVLIWNNLLYLFIVIDGAQRMAVGWQWLEGMIY